MRQAMLTPSPPAALTWIKTVWALGAANAISCCARRCRRNICCCAELSRHNPLNGEIQMKLWLAAIATAAMLGTALPACAEEVGVGVGPVGVTVGEHHDRD